MVTQDSLCNTTTVSGGQCKSWVVSVWGCTDAGHWHQVTDIDCFCRHWAVFPPRISMPGSSRPSNTNFIPRRQTMQRCCRFPSQSPTRGMDAQDDGVYSTLSADYTTANSAPGAVYSRSCSTSGLEAGGVNPKPPKTSLQAVVDAESRPSIPRWGKRSPPGRRRGLCTPYPGRYLWLSHLSSLWHTAGSPQNNMVFSKYFAFSPAIFLPLTELCIGPP